MVEVFQAKLIGSDAVVPGPRVYPGKVRQGGVTVHPVVADTVGEESRVAGDDGAFVFGYRWFSAAGSRARCGLFAGTRDVRTAGDFRRSWRTAL